MVWDEFIALLSGLDENTPLGRIISIRAEDNKEVLKNFSQSQLKIRSDYRSKMLKNVSSEQMDDTLKQFQNMFMAMAGT